MARRYLIDNQIDFEKTTSYDCIIIGSGIAGLFTALSLSPERRVLILTKSELIDSNSSLAQGGIAAALQSDDVAVHIEDTIKAGSAYNDINAVESMVLDAKERVEDLLSLGVEFDRDEDGVLLATKEGGHTSRRVLHYKDYTGEAITRGLLDAALKRENIQFAQHTIAVDILEQEGQAVGVLTVQGEKTEVVSSRNIVLATGGVGGLYDATTNTTILTGDGLGMAIRAQVQIKDLEFIQFHPTAFSSKEKTFLISEAVRGEGGYLVNSSGYRFMQNLHPLKELAPRDIVAKAMFDQMVSGDQIFLDVRHLGKEYLTNRFPTIYQNCLDAGFDMDVDLVPVRPVQHYVMGGIETDLNGVTNIKGLYACGEVARTGVHGANRLASNSLLEAVVYAYRVALTLESNFDERPITGVFSSKDNDMFKVESNIEFNAEIIKSEIRKILSTSAFIIRDDQRLVEGIQAIEVLIKKLDQASIHSRGQIEAANMIMVAEQILKAAYSRKETLGSHIMHRKEDES